MDANDLIRLRLGRIIVILTAVLASLPSHMKFREVKAALGYKANSSVYDWLKLNGITGNGRKYDRQAVIAALLK